MRGHFERIRGRGYGEARCHGNDYDENISSTYYNRCGDTPGCSGSMFL